MDKEVECGVTLRLNIFNIYWNLMKRNYHDTQHTAEDFKLYYSIFKEYKEQDFIYAVKMVIKYQPYFPRVDEIVQFLPDIDGVKTNSNKNIPDWFNKNLENKDLTQEEQEDLDEIISKLTKEEGM